MAAAAVTPAAGSNSQREWPPSLKNFVSKVFGQCTDSSRAAVEKELKQAIYKAYADNSLWSIDWESFRLQSLNSTPPPDASTSGGKRKKNELSKHAGLSKDEDMKNKRAKRFQESPTVLQPTQIKAKFKPVAPSLYGRVQGVGYASASTPEPEHNPDVIDWDKHTIVGTSAILEKPYLRLTSVPDPANVRPLPVLKQSLDLLKKKWRSEGNYGYICDQFKSMRQDLTVQRIKNDFTVSVYEIHARIALERGDLGEYNQCQSQLRHLYSHGLQGHPEEFLAYRILYLLHTRNRRDVNGLLSSLSPQERQDESVQHALAVRSALATSNYHAFFKLFHSAPKMGAYLMDHFLARERISALHVMSKAYITLPVSFISSELAFDSSKEAQAFLESHQVAVYQGTPKAGEQQWDCRAVRETMALSMASYTKVDIKGQI